MPPVRQQPTRAARQKLMPEPDPEPEPPSSARPKKRARVPKMSAAASETTVAASDRASTGAKKARPATDRASTDAENTGAAPGARDRLAEDSDRRLTEAARSGPTDNTSIFSNKNSMWAYFKKYIDPKANESSIKTYNTSWNHINTSRVDYNNNHDTDLEMFDYLTSTAGLDHLVKFIDDNIGTAGSKAGRVKFALFMIDKFPHFYVPRLTRFRDSEALNNVRIYVAAKLQENSAAAQAKKDALAYPTEDVLLRRIKDAWPDPLNTLSILCHLYYEVGARNDFALRVYFTDDPDDEERKKINYVVVPKTGSVILKLNSFKTEGKIEAWITRFELSDGLSDKIRRYVAKHKIKANGYLFEDTDAKMGQLVSKAIAQIGYGHMSENFFRRWKASWTRYQLLRGAITKEDEARVVLSMQHGFDAHEKSYVYPIDDGTGPDAATRRNRQCQQIAPCVREMVLKTMREEEAKDADEPAPKQRKT